MKSEGISLAAGWAWYLSFMPQYNVTTDSHPLLLQRIAEFNAQYAKE